MSITLTALTVASLLRSLTAIAAWALNIRTLKDREKTSPFECGFDPKSSARIPFSLRFFLLGIIFIIFDIEIVLIIPLPIILNLINLNAPYIVASLFLTILLIGLLHEWREGSLNWA